jgi:signal transduction histidine kinase
LIGKSFEPIKRSIKNLEDFNTNINHEFKTPLAEIISTLELSKRTHDYERSTESALTSSKKLLKILENLGFMISFTSPIFKNEKINIYAISKTVEE